MSPLALPVSAKVLSALCRMLSISIVSQHGLANVKCQATLYVFGRVPKTETGSGPIPRQPQPPLRDHAAQHFAGAAVDARRGGMAIAFLHLAQAFVAAQQRLRCG